MKSPWFKFYPSDWRSDEQLRNCSIAARGLWIEMLCLMHKSVPYGHFLISGEMPTMTQVSMQTGIPESQITDLIGELERSGVFSRNEKGVIFSRKLVRDEKASKEGKKHYQKRGISKDPDSPPSRSPTRGPSSQNPEPIYQIDNPPLPPKTQGFGMFDIKNLLSDDGWMDARSQAPGWDIHYLAGKYNEWVNAGQAKPRSPNKAFPAWCKSFTKGKRPS